MSASWTTEEEEALCKMARDDLSIPEMCARTGRPPGGVRSKLTKLRKQGRAPHRGHGGRPRRRPRGCDAWEQLQASHRRTLAIACDGLGFQPIHPNSWETCWNLKKMGYVYLNDTNGRFKATERGLAIVPEAEIPGGPANALTLL